MMALSVGREISLNIPAGDDFASWCMAAMAFLGLAHTFKSGEMIRVGLLIDRLRGRARWYFEMFSLVLGVGFVGFFAWHAVQMTYDSWRFNDMSQGVVAVPLWIPQLGYSGGLVILFIAFVDEFVARRRRRRAALREAAAEDAPRKSSSARSRAGSEPMDDDPDRRVLLSCSLLTALLAGGVWIAIALMAVRLGRHAVRRRQRSRPARCSRRRSGATRPRGRSPRCRCSSGWARSSSAPGSPRRCSAGSSPWLNWLPGRLMHVNVLACGIFGSVSGSSAATCATVAKIALPELKKRGYDEKLSLGSLAGAGTLGILIPPSITDGGLRRRGERLDHPDLPRRLPARACS